MVEVTLTEFRKKLFALADQTLETGVPLRLRRKGRVLVLRAEPDAPRARLLAYLEQAVAADDEAGMTDDERRLFDLSDVAESGEASRTDLSA